MVAALHETVASEGSPDRVSPLPAAPPLLRVRDLRFAYGARGVLAGLGVSVARGEIVGLLGPNGSGKSTAIGVLAGLLRPDGGTLEVDGVVAAFGDRDLRARTGFVFQQPSLDPRLSARENLALAARLHGLTGTEGRRRVDAALTLVELGGRAPDAVRTLSGGMRRRIDLARALLHDPDLLVLDEPSSGLDEHAFRRVWEHLLAERERRALAVLVSTHRPEEAERCDRLLVLDQGRVVAEGRPAELRARVHGDVVTLEADDAAELGALVQERFGLEGTVGPTGRTLTLVRERGHELVPRLVEALPPGRLRAVSLHTPTLADVFLALTGRSLDVDAEEAA